MPRISELPATPASPALDLGSLLPIVNQNTGQTERITLTLLIQLLGLLRTADLTAVNASIAAAASAADAAATSAKLARWTIPDAGQDLSGATSKAAATMTFASTTMSVSWSNVALIDGSASIQQIADKGTTTLTPGQCLYIDTTTATRPYPTLTGNLSTLASALAAGTAVLVVGNYNGLAIGPVAELATVQRLRADLGTRGAQSPVFDQLAAIQTALTATTATANGARTDLGTRGAQDPVFTQLAAIQTTLATAAANALTAVAQAKLSRWRFFSGANDLRTTGTRTLFNFSQTGDVMTVGWSYLRLLDGASAVVAVNDQADTALSNGQCLYIDASGSAPYTAAVGTMSSLMASFVTGTNVLLIGNQTGLPVGTLADAMALQRLRNDLGARGAQDPVFTQLATFGANVTYLLTQAATNRDAIKTIRDGVGEAAGFALLLDGANNVLLRKTPLGLDFIPDPAVAERVGVGIGKTTKALRGRPLMLDKDGNVLIEKQPSGINFIPSDDLKSLLGGAIAGAPAGAIYSKRDTAGRLVYGYALENGLVEEYVVVGGYPLLRGNSSLGQVTMDIITLNGQSLSVGNSFTDVANAPTITAADDAFVLDGLKDLTNDLTVRGWLSRAYTATSPVALATGVKPLVMGNTTLDPYPTPATGIAGGVNRHRRAVGGRRGSVLSVCHGYSGVSWEQIDKYSGTGTGETVIWDNLVFWYQQAKAAMTLLGIEGRVPYHCMVHGTSAKSDASPIYYNFLTTYLADFRALMGTVGFNTDTRLVLTQDAGDSTTQQVGELWDVCLDQLRFCQEGKAILAGPLYPIRISDNNVHPDGENTLLMGDIFARAIAEEDAGRAWTTLGPVWWQVSGNSVTIFFDTRPDEVLALHSAGKYTGGIDSWAGFQCPGTTITAMSVGANWVKLTCAAAPTSVKYAMQQQDVTGINDGYVAHRGLLRSTYSWKAKWSGTTLYRWAPSFAITL